MEATSLENELVAKVTARMAERTVRVGRLQKEIETANEENKNDKALLLALRATLGVKTAEGYGAKSNSVQAAIEALQNSRFTQDDVEEELRRSHPEMELDRNRIRATIWNLCTKRKAIKLIRKGNNRKPAEFEKVIPVDQQAQSRNGDPNNAHPSNEPKDASGSSEITKAILGMNESFNLDSVAALVPSAKRAQISTSLYRLKKARKIEATEEGGGRKAGKYKVIR